MTCTRAEWSVEHGCFYLTLSVPIAKATPLVIRDVAMRVDGDGIRVTPPPSVDWPEEWSHEARRAAVKRLWAMRARNTRKVKYYANG